MDLESPFMRTGIKLPQPSRYVSHLSFVSLGDIELEIHHESKFCRLKQICFSNFAQMNSCSKLFLLRSRFAHDTGRVIASRSNGGNWGGARFRLWQSVKDWDADMVTILLRIFHESKNDLWLRWLKNVYIMSTTCCTLDPACYSVDFERCRRFLFCDTS